MAADTAHGWARNISLGNPAAKSVLLALTFYCDDQGHAIPSLQTLADDTDLSVDTVRRRLEFLEGCGAIVRLPRYLDDRGRTTYEKGGKQTTDEIRFQFDTDPEEIEARARGREPTPKSVSPSQQPPPSPSQQPPLNGEQDSVGTRLGVAQPSHGSHPCNGNGDAEEKTPHPLKGDLRASGEASEAGDRSEPDGFAEFFEAYPEFRLMDRRRAVDVWRVMSQDERTRATAALPAFRAELDKAKRKPKDAHRWLRERGYEPFEGASAASSTVFQVREGTPQWHAWDLYYRVCRQRKRGGDGLPYYAVTGPEGSRVAMLPREWPPLCGTEADFDKWTPVFEGSGQFAAWLKRLREVPNIAINLFNDTSRQCRALRVPQEWPPAKNSKPEQQQESA